jgi:stage IV sporulation protein FB
MLKIPGSIPISIHPFFWLLAGFIGWSSSHSVEETLIWMGVIFVSVVVHEFGHALTAVACGQKASIELIGLGGVTQRQGSKLKLWQEFLIVLNGPLAGLVLCVIAAAVSFSLPAVQSSPALLKWSYTISYVNLVWTLLNLLPVQPLDGGMLLSIVLESLFGFKGIKVALFLSLLFSGVLSLYFFSQRSFLVGSLFFLFTYENWQAWKTSKILSEEDQNLAFQHLLKDAERDLSYGRKNEALSKFINIKNLAKSGVIHLAASEYAAAILFDESNYQAAYEILNPLSSKLNPGGLRLLHQLAYRQGFWNEAILLGNKVYQNVPHYEVALMNAISHSVLGNIKPAIGWLKCTIRDGMPNVKEVLEKKEFDLIRNDPLFPQITIPK